MQRPMPRALAELFRDWHPDTLDTVPELEAVFSAGHSNRSFLVRLGGRRVVVRLPEGNGERLGIDRRVEQRVLKLGSALGDQWLVTAGLAAGERLIVEGRQKVKAGDVVRAVPAGDAATR